MKHIKVKTEQIHCVNMQVVCTHCGTLIGIHFDYKKQGRKLSKKEMNKFLTENEK